ncbi:hypothetical protein JL722_5998 [Aureococcus anophagefferens]|nr:hypothetical protein JL722_5998 [Aureococcus anophagefferens]
MIITEIRRAVKRRRFHRVPVPPPPAATSKSTTRAGLLVDGDPWIGQGWYVAATSNVSWNDSLERLADVIVYENAPKGINQGMPYGLSAHPPKAQLAFLDAVHRVGFKVIYPVVSGNVSINHGGPFDDSDKLEALRASVELDCGNTWMFTDQAPSWLKSEQDDGDRVLPVATQPALQLSLDVVMQENYGGTLAAHAGTGAWAGGVGGDGWFRNGAAFEPVYNCPGPSRGRGRPTRTWRPCGSARSTGMYSDLNFIYTEAEYGGPVYPGKARPPTPGSSRSSRPSSRSTSRICDRRRGAFAPSTRRPRLPAEIRARAWAVPDRGALNCSTILAVVNTNETRAHDVSSASTAGRRPATLSTRGGAPSSSGHASRGHARPGRLAPRRLKTTDACA